MKIRKSLIFSLALLFAGLTVSSCTPKTGCKINEEAHAKTGKDGKFKKSKTKSGLFPKNMRRK